MRLQWHEHKRLENLDKHKMDFADAVELFRGAHYTEYSPRRGEARWLSVGLINGLEYAAAWTRRGDAVHIISLRRARGEERRRYRDLFG
ncbi:MAG TPA: BrnT family toxin [Geminicoccaceae bacterium]|nr:BrnT family toxin [Geminicoccaceae bacterium]